MRHVCSLNRWRAGYQQRCWSFHPRLADFVRVVHRSAVARGNPLRVEPSRYCGVDHCTHRFDCRVDLVGRTTPLDEMVGLGGARHGVGPGNSRWTDGSLAPAPMGVFGARGGWANLLLHRRGHRSFHRTAMDRRSSTSGTRYPQTEPDYADLAINFRPLPPVNRRRDVPPSWNELVAARGACPRRSPGFDLDIDSCLVFVLENPSDSAPRRGHDRSADCAAMPRFPGISDAHCLGA